MNTFTMLLFPSLGILLGTAEIYYYDWQFWVLLAWGIAICLSERLNRS